MNSAQVIPRSIVKAIQRACWWVLACLSVLLQCVNALRRRLAHTVLCAPPVFNVPIISIGNISFGGRGKTPVTIALAQYLATEGVRVLIISRGYQRQSSVACHIVQPTDDSRWVGDEPRLMAEACADWPLIHVMVAASRRVGIRYGLAQLQAQVILLDDALSHFSVRATFSIVCVAGSDLKWLALRREFRSVLAHQQVVLSDEQINWPGITARVLERTPYCLKRPHHQDCITLESYVGKRVIIAAGIANPERLLRTVEKLGFQVVGTHFVRDHAPLSEAWLFNVVSKMQTGQCDAVIITAKDAVKRLTWPAGIYVLEERVQLDAVVKQLVWAHVRQF